MLPLEDGELRCNGGYWKMMEVEKEASLFLKDMFLRTSRQGSGRRVRLHELGQLMGRDQEACIATIARLRRLGYVDIVGGRVIITDAGYDALDLPYSPGIDYDELALTIEALESRVSDLELKFEEEICELREELRSLLDDIRTGKANKVGTRRKLWGISDQLINSGANVATIVSFLRMMWPFMSGC
jgi:hypothetical protein